MKVTNAAISLNVPDPAASAAFLQQHFDFTVEMEAEGFVSLTRPDIGFNIIYLQTGLGTFKPESHAGAAGNGLLIVLVVENIDGEWERLQNRDLTFPTPIETEPWGERFFQVLDPNGILIQLVQWMSEG